MDLMSGSNLRNDVWVRNSMAQGTLHLGNPTRVFYALFMTISALAPFLLYTKGGQLIKSLQQSRSKAKVPFFWAVASLAHVFNIYITKFLITTCYPYGRRHMYASQNYTAVHFLLGFTLISSHMIAYIHSKYITLPIPIS